jgi:hypothetical protein
MSFIAAEPIALSQHGLFSPAECSGIRNDVLALKEYWSPRSKNSFYTLGTAAYLDAQQSHADYLAAASEVNPVLRSTFAGMLETTRAFFEDLLFDKVEIADRLGVPGFHIFKLDGSARADRPAQRAHFDLQWMSALPGQEVQGTISFTVAIEQPTGGAAMQVWPLHYGQLVAGGVPLGDYAAKRSSRRVAYSHGGVTVHDGNILHAIGASTDACPKGWRITLQGHGALVDGTWVLYW